jgi:hypothetical protein
MLTLESVEPRPEDVCRGSAWIRRGFFGVVEVQPIVVMLTLESVEPRHEDVVEHLGVVEDNP